MADCGCITPVAHTSGPSCKSSIESIFFFSSRRRHTRFDCDWSSDVCSSDLILTSALTGEFVEDVFNALAIEMVNRAFRQEDTRAAERSLRDKALVLLDKRGSVGLKKQQFFQILRGVKVDDLQAELDRLEREGLVTILWYGASDFAVTITPRGVKAVKQASTWEG